MMKPFGVMYNGNMSIGEIWDSVQYGLQEQNLICLFVMISKRENMWNGVIQSVLYSV